MHDVCLKKAKLKEGIQEFQKDHQSYKYIECQYNNGIGILFQPVECIKHMLNND